MSSNASHGSHGWFEGMMDVILGMALRLSMPQPYATRPVSAPNSPARNAFDNFPSINLLPLRDSLDCSIHNKSGHGKSIVQIVRDIKSESLQCPSLGQVGRHGSKFMNQLILATNELKEKDRRKSL
jgi:hypothetical protein